MLLHNLLCVQRPFDAMSVVEQMQYEKSKHEFKSNIFETSLEQSRRDR
jgi:hypothetical protein